MAMMHTSLLKHYERLFAFKQYHGWNIDEINDLIPWELDVVISMLSNYLETVELRKKQQALQQR
jgi:hypothetical protein